MAKARPKEKRVIWRAAVEALVQSNPPEDHITTETLEEKLGMRPTAASQLLGRLRRWGYVRLVGFSPSAGGRRQHVYELTDMARKYAQYRARRAAQ